jgi:hypothetical protein
VALLQLLRSIRVGIATLDLGAALMPPWCDPAARSPPSMSLILGIDIFDHSTDHLDHHW